MIFFCFYTKKVYMPVKKTKKEDCMYVCMGVRVNKQEITRHKLAKEMSIDCKRRKPLNQLTKPTRWKTIFTRFTFFLIILAEFFSDERKKEKKINRLGHTQTHRHRQTKQIKKFHKKTSRVDVCMFYFNTYYFHQLQKRNHTHPHTHPHTHTEAETRCEEKRKRKTSEKEKEKSSKWKQRHVSSKEK